MTTSTVTISKFPAHKVGAATAAVAKAHAKLVKSAAKTGQTPVEAPVLTVSEPYVTKEESDDDNGLDVVLVDIVITYPRPALAGWEFAAVVEPLEGANLVKGVPGCTVALDSTPYRSGSIVCTHCNTARKRTETFLVVADGTDPVIALGTVKQVGRNCLKDFLGGKSAADILASFGYEKLIREIGDGEGGCSGAPRAYVPTELLAWTIGAIRLNGWVSKGAARDQEGVQATASFVLWLLNPPFGSAASKWKEDRTACKPTEVDLAKAALILDYAKSLDGATDYEYNLRTVAAQSVISEKHVGIFCSAVASYERHIGKQLEKARYDANKGASAFVGEVKAKLSLTLTVDKVFTIETQYGALHINKFRDADGNVLVWKTSTTRFEPGETKVLKGTVKAHTEFRGEKQTELTRCSTV